MSWLTVIALLLSLASLAVNYGVWRDLRDMERKRRAMRGPYSQPYRYRCAEKREAYQTTKTVPRKR